MTNAILDLSLFKSDPTFLKQLLLRIGDVQSKIYLRNSVCLSVTLQFFVRAIIPKPLNGLISNGSADQTHNLL